MDCVPDSLECSNQQCKCTVTSCVAGCCQGNQCKPGTANNECGINGKICQDCTVQDLLCKVHICMPEQCGPDSCAGCCSGLGACLPGDSHDACGIGGDWCLGCDEDEECVLGQCKCTSASCPGGCCAGDECKTPGDLNIFCGDNGEACDDCLENYDPPRECVDGVCVGCVPDCQDKACGPDGCGAQCLPGCDAGWACDSGTCTPTNCCENKGTPGCNDPECNGLVCAYDPYCCDTEWDGFCVDEASQICVVCGGTCDTECENIECGHGMCGGLCGECPDGKACIGTACQDSPSSCCGWKLAPGCPDDPDCDDYVCGAYPDCCISEWSVDCGFLALNMCGLCSGS